MKIFVLTIVDLRNVGYCPKDVELFATREEAGKRMRELYAEYAEKAQIETPFDGVNNIDYCYEENCYASVWDTCYLDIWEKEIDTDVKVEETNVENYLVDRDGKHYNEDESWPAGGGLDSRCDYNDLALHCYYDREDMESIHKCLKEEGFDDPIHSDEGMEIWEKGNTRIVFENYQGGMWGYLHTEYIETKNPTEETETPAEEKTPFKIDYTKATKKYGFDYFEIPTEVAIESVNDNLWDGDEVMWWEVAELPNGDVIWEDNTMGAIMIVTHEDRSYFRWI